MSTIASLRNQMIAGTLTPQTQVNELKYIGPHITAQLQAQQINDIDELLTHVGQLNFNDLKEFLTTVTRNRHANQCSPRLRRRGVPRGGGRGRGGGVGRGGVQTRAQRAAAAAAAAAGGAAGVGAAGATGPYHVREVNRSGFNTLRNLLAAAAQQWPGQYQYNPRLPTEHGNRDAPTALCSCKTTQPLCAAQPGCRWETVARGRGRGARSLCIPTTNNPGFEGIDGFSGQRRIARLHNQNLDFIGGWRVPDPYR